MRPHVVVETTVGTLREMTIEQFTALQENVLAEGIWETQTETLRIVGTDPVGVHTHAMFIGIESDGYTHS